MNVWIVNIFDGIDYCDTMVFISENKAKEYIENYQKILTV